MRKKQLNFIATARAKCSRHDRMMCCTSADTTVLVLAQEVGTSGCVSRSEEKLLGTTLGVSFASPIGVSDAGCLLHELEQVSVVLREAVGPVGHGPHLLPPVHRPATHERKEQHSSCQQEAAAIQDEYEEP